MLNVKILLVHTHVPVKLVTVGMDVSVMTLMNARLSNQCSNNSICNNTNGSYTCLCKPGSAQDGMKCIQLTCPKGKYIDENFICQDCPLNAYNIIAEAAQTLCISCPENHFTESEGSTSPGDCKCKNNVYY